MAGTDRSLDERAMRTLELALDHALASGDDDLAALELGVRVAELLLNARLVAPPPPRAPGRRRPRLSIAAAATGFDDEALREAIEHARTTIELEYGVVVPHPSIDVGHGASDERIEVRLDGIPIHEVDADVDAVALAASFRDVAVRHLAELLTREEVAELLNAAREHSPMVVQELVPNMLALGQLRQVLQNLVREQVPITDLSTILNALADNSVYTKDPYALTEHVRAALGRTICARYQSSDGTLQAFMLSPDAERAIQNSIQLNETGQLLMLDPNTSLALQQNLVDALERHRERMPDPLLITPPKLRRHVRSLLERNFSKVVTLSYSEIVAGVHIDNLETIEATRPGVPAPEPAPPTTGPMAPGPPVDLGDASDWSW